MALSSRPWLANYAGKSVSRRKFLAGAAAGAGAAALMACSGSGSGGDLRLSSNSAREPGSVWLYSNNWKLEDETKNAVSGGVYRGSWARDNAAGYDAILAPPAQTPFQSHVYEYVMGK